MTENKLPDTIVICMGSSCFSRGNKGGVSIIKQYLEEKGLRDKVVFRGAHCFGICESGPVLQIGDKKYTQVSAGQITDLLDQHFIQ